MVEVPGYKSTIRQWKRMVKLNLYVSKCGHGKHWQCNVVSQLRNIMNYEYSTGSKSHHNGCSSIIHPPKGSCLTNYTSLYISIYIILFISILINHQKPLVWACHTTKLSHKKGHWERWQLSTGKLFQKLCCGISLPCGSLKKLLIFLDFDVITWNLSCDMSIQDSMCLIWFIIAS